MLFSRIKNKSFPNTKLLLYEIHNFKKRKNWFWQEKVAVLQNETHQWNKSKCDFTAKSLDVMIESCCYAKFKILRQNIAIPCLKIQYFMTKISNIKLTFQFFFGDFMAKCHNYTTEAQFYRKTCVTHV